MAPGIFQRTLESLLQGVPRTAVYLDDILVSGSSLADHHRNLELVLSKLHQSGLRLKREKCVFLQKSVTYLGHVIDHEGIHPADSKLQGILDAEAPQNLGELCAYLGIINYYNKFLPNASSVLKPLYDLLHQDTKWSWGKDQAEAFQLSKDLLSSNRLLVHYDPRLNIFLECDASPHGLGVVLTQETSNGDFKPVAYASRMLSATEQKYSQLEKEGLSVIFGVKRFHNYLFGRHFTIVTDHKPLLGLFTESKPTPSLASARIQRWSLILGGYNYKLTYKPGHKHLNADALSRIRSNHVKPCEPPEPQEVILSFNFVQNTSQEPVSAKEIASETLRNPVLSRIMQYVMHGWPQKCNDPDLRPYFLRKQELSVQADCLLWGARVIVPQKFRKSILAELHQQHPGIVKMKMLSQSYVWWPGLGTEIEQLVKEYTPCQTHANIPAQAPLHPWNFHSAPWSRIHIDFAGPIENKMLLIIVDATSKFMDVHVMNKTTSQQTIDRLRHTFALNGLPKELVSDNGPQFTSAEFSEFCKVNGIRHIRTSPYHPASNGQAERSVQTIKSGLNKIQEGSLETKLYRFLLMYNITPHATTGESPSMILMKRQLRTRLDQLKPDLESKVMQGQEKMKTHHDRHAKERELSIGSAVYARNFLSQPKWMPGILVESRGPVTFLVELNDGRIWKRHIDHIKPRYLSLDKEDQTVKNPDDRIRKPVLPSMPPERYYQPNPCVKSVPSLLESLDRSNNVANQKQDESITNQNVPKDDTGLTKPKGLPDVTIRRSTRSRRAPDRFTDFVTPSIKQNGP